MKRQVSMLLIASLAAGCATTPADFDRVRYTISDTNLCRTYANAHGDFLTKVEEEVERRHLSSSDCQTLINKQNLAIGVGAILGAALVAAARRGGGGGGTYTPPPTRATDYDWDWDEFYNANRQLVWACRGVQTGEFAEQWHCNGTPQTDWRWPSKELVR